MARIRIEDLPKDQRISRAEMKKISGSGYANGSGNGFGNGFGNGMGGNVGGNGMSGNGLYGNSLPTSSVAYYKEP